jgi:hypothetical protein
VRYRFRGLVRDTGQPVEGHVEAATEEEAYNVLGENGFITESVRPDPKPLNLGNMPQMPYGDAIDSALDTSSRQIPFDTLQERFRGKQVWVIDREKIRRRVAEVVDQILAANMGSGENDALTRQRVAEAIDGLFKDNRNITSRVDQVNQTLQQTTRSAHEINTNLERQISRLAGFITKAEDVLNRISAAARSGGFGFAGGYAPKRGRVVGTGQEQNAVLKEIFEHNLTLLRKFEGTSDENVPSDEEVRAAAGAGGGGGGEGGTATAIAEAPPTTDAEGNSEPPAE